MVSGQRHPPPRRFKPWNNTVPIVQETGWDPGPVFTVIENLTPIWFRAPDRQSVASRCTE